MARAVGANYTGEARLKHTHTLITVDGWWASPKELY